MSDQFSKEVLLKFAADLSAVKPEFQDLSKLMQDRINQIDEADKKIKAHASTTVNEAQKINKAFQSNINQIKEEVKTIDQLDKAAKSFTAKNAKLFDTKNIEDFRKKAEELFKVLSKDLGISFTATDLDDFSKDIISAKTEIEATAKVVEFFEQKLKDAGQNGAVSLGLIKTEIQDVKDFIVQTENEIKTLDKQIEDSAPGRMQAGLIQDRERLNQTVQEAKLNLEGLNAEHKVLQTETAKTTQNQKTLETQLRAVKESMRQLELEGKSDSQMYDQLRTKATQYQKAIKDVNDEVKYSASDTSGIQSVIGAVNGLVGIYATAQGAAALFGNESEALDETITKLGGALAILNGLQATQAELANKQGLANKTLTYIQGQYTIATNASATATTRLAAATKLLGIGLLVGALAAVVVYWKDIAKWIGITSEEAELNNTISAKSNELYGAQIAQLTILNKRIKEGGMSFREKNMAVKEFNESFGKTLGSVKDFNELESRMIKNGEIYIQYVKIKAQAEAAYQLAIENTTKAIEIREKALNKDYTAWDKFSRAIEGGLSDATTWLRGNGKRGFGAIARDLTDADFEALMGLPDENSVEKFLDEYSISNREILERFYKDNRNSVSALEVASNANEILDDLEKKAKDIIPDVEQKTKKAAKAAKDWTDEIKKLIAELIRLQEAYRVAAISNDREREIAERRLQFQEEKQGFQDQIDAIKVSNDKKLRLISEFNKLYNEQSGLAYEQMLDDIKEIEKKYFEEAQEVRFRAAQAINEANGLSNQNELDNIKKKWEDIRKELTRQISLTRNLEEKTLLIDRYKEIDSAELREINNFIFRKNIERIELEKQMADAVVQIYLNQSKQIIGNEKLKQQTLLQIQAIYFKNRLNALRESLNEEQKLQFDEFLNNFSKSDGNLDQFGAIADKMKAAFGPEIANQITTIVAELAKVNKEAKDLSKNNLTDWFKDTTSFSTKLGEALGLEGEQLKVFGETMGEALNQVWGAMNQIMDANIQDHQNKLSEIETLIGQTESELEREKQLYEDGYANNYSIKQQELDDLKKQKAEEKKELEKAQKIKAAINQATILSDLAATVVSMVSAAAKVMDGTSGVPFVGVALGIGLVAAMFAAMAGFKAQAQSFKSYRTGLEQGPLNLLGASHERGGIGLYDSASGRKVAEYEGGEQLYALNKNQQSKYGWMMQAMIDDANGRRPMMDSFMARIPTTGKKTLMKVREVNEISRSAHNRRAEASNEQRELLKEMRKLNSSFENELGGHKNREESKTETWETTHYLYVKKNGVTKKYKKKSDE